MKQSKRNKHCDVPLDEIVAPNGTL